MSSDPPYSIDPKIPSPYRTLFYRFESALEQKEKGKDALLEPVRIILERVEEDKPPNSPEQAGWKEDPSTPGRLQWLRTKCIFLTIRDVLRLYWTFSKRKVKDEEGQSEWTIFAHPPDFEEAASKHGTREIKSRMQDALSRTRDEQLESESTRSFIRRMEKSRLHEEDQEGVRRASVQDLFLSPEKLASDLREFADAPVHEQLGQLSEIIQPYLQQVGPDDKDAHTGLRLLDIWRYARCTWSIPQKQTPGRRMRYLVRDAARKHDPIIGIGALGSGVMQLTVRDEEIGWSPIALARRSRIKERFSENSEKGFPEPFSSRRANVVREWDFRRIFGRDVVSSIRSLKDRLDDGVRNLYLKDVIEEGHLSKQDIEKPSRQTIDKVSDLKESLEKATSNSEFTESDDLEDDARSELYRRKRLTVLERLLNAKRTLAQFLEETGRKSGPDIRGAAVRNKNVRQALKTALRSVKKSRIAGLMDITTCGAVPPYNEVLGGKLVSFLMASPQVIAEYREKYRDQVSTIASRMNGEEVVRPPELALLSTTSLYVVGSSQYNRLKAPTANGELEYREIGTSEGYGHIHISQETFEALRELLAELSKRHDEIERPSSQFGSGVNYRMRTISLALSKLGIGALDKHKQPRLVYLVPLATNWREYLVGHEKSPNYIYEDTEESYELETSALVDFWRIRWFFKRAQKEKIIDRIESEYDKVEVSNIISIKEGDLFEGVEG